MENNLERQFMPTLLENNFEGPMCINGNTSPHMNIKNAYHGKHQNETDQILMITKKI